jgi:hypothetical protein
MEHIPRIQPEVAPNEQSEAAAEGHKPREELHESRSGADHVGFPEFRVESADHLVVSTASASANTTSCSVSPARRDAG